MYLPEHNRGVLEGLRGQIDDIMETRLIEDMIDPKRNNKKSIKALKQAAKDRKFAIPAYREIKDLKNLLI